MGGQVKYPDDFDTPSFPAGRPVAVSRMVSVAVMIVFLLIAFTCAMLFWTQRSVQVHPFLVSINPITSQWEIVGHHHKETAEISAARALQESVIGKFMRNWFWIVNDEDINSARWKSCDRITECAPNSVTDVLADECAIYCISSEEMYLHFVEQIVPNYQTRIMNGENWELDMSSLQITPVGAVNAAGGMWQIRANIISNISGIITILAYAQVGYEKDEYAKTMGYYVKDFNAYKIQ